MKILFLILLFFLFPLNVLAQEENKSSNIIDVETIVGAQSVINNKIPVTVKFRTNFDSDNVEIKWDIPYGLESDSKTSSIVAKAGETYTLEKYISPILPGSYTVTVNVVAWQYNTNYTESSSSTVEIDENLKVSPQDPQYMTYNIIKWVVISLLSVGVVFGVYTIGRKVSKNFVKWLKPPI